MASLPPSRSSRSASSSASTPAANRRLFADRDRRALDQRRRRCRRQLRRASSHCRERFRRARPLDADAARSACATRRQRRERIAERAQLARCAAPGRRLGRETLDVAHAVDRLAHRGARRSDRRRTVATASSRRRSPYALGERRENPLAQQPRAHRRAACDRARESSVPSAPPPRSDSTSSRLRRVISSSGITPPGRSTIGRASCGSPPGCSSRR